jgi:hypothetical protein
LSPASFDKWQLSTKQAYKEALVRAEDRISERRRRECQWQVLLAAWVTTIAIASVLKIWP